MPAVGAARFEVFASWPVDIAANLLISATFLIIAALILGPLWRLGQLRANWLATVAAAVFVCAGVGRAGQALHVSMMGGSVDQAFQDLQSWQAGWDVLTALVAVTYLLLRKRQARVLDSAPLFDDLAHVQHVRELAELRAERAARAAAEAERDASAAMFGSIIANSHSAIYVKDLQGRYLMVNPPLLTILGKSAAEVLGEPDRAHSGDADQVWRVNDRRAEEGPYRVQEWNDDFADGRHVFDSIKFPLRDADGVLYATGGASLDVTGLTRAVASAAEARDRAVAAAAAKSTFLATMSHEIRTPMNAVIGLTDLLTDTNLDEAQQELVNTVRSSGEALLAIINDILDFSKIESGELQLEAAAFSLRDAVEGCLDLVATTAAAKRLELICHFDSSCPDHVIGDAVRIRQIVANLLSNAVKFTEAGEVFVAVTGSPTADERLLVTVTVTDTGIGITTDGLDRVFGSFSQVDASTTRTHGGTGLGLAITQSLANAMHGQATITSTPGTGTSVTVTVVLDPDPHPSEELPRTTGTNAVAGKRVLLVDDNPTTLRVLALQVAALGMPCTSAHTAVGALGLVNAGLNYDVAIIDADLPDMDGPHLSAALHTLTGTVTTPHVRLAPTGWPPDPSDHTFANSLTKPVKAAALRDALAAALATQTREAAGSPPGIEHPSPNAPQPLRILLAEDNPVNQRVAQLILNKLGHRVDIADDGSEAVDAVHNRLYDVVLMDVQMPNMDGLQAARLIRANPTQHQPHIVAVTASAQPEDRDACLAAGMNGYLAKPIRARDLDRILSDLRPPSPAPADQPSRTQSGPTPAHTEPPTTAETVPREAVTDPDTPATDADVPQHKNVALADIDTARRSDRMATYLAETRHQLDKLRNAVQHSDTGTAAAITHTLKSTSALIATRLLADLLYQTETAARSDPDALPALTQRLLTEYGAITETLLQASSQTPITLHPHAVPPLTC
jgi:PAS domain S-box-containing protein